MSDLSEAAEIWGIEDGYHDVFGNYHRTDQAVLQRLIAALSQGRERPPFGESLAAPAEPVRAFQGDGQRHWVLAVQLYALRSRRNWGHGDFGDLLRLLPIAARYGAAGIGLNPLHALFPDRAEQASPYAPNSRLFLNPLYIDVEAIPEFPGLAAVGLDADVAALRETTLVAYDGVARAKLHALRAAYERFRVEADPKRHRAFESYRAEQGESLMRFACFECLRQQHAPQPWPQWPEPWRRPEADVLQRFRHDHLADCEFHEFLQWIADEQLQRCRDEAKHLGLPVGLYIDLAVGVHPDGADAWSQQQVILAQLSVGAPPDEFNSAGQDWGLAAFNPQMLPQNDFGPMRQLMRAIMRYAGAVRVDHILGLKRTYMVPHGFGPADGAYVRFPFEDLLTVLAEESLRLRCVVIGEDLGTVPEGFRETMSRWGLWSYRVMLFEREHEARFRHPEAYPAEALATFNTHDLPSFRGWMSGHDMRVKREIRVDPGESDDARGWSQHQLRSILAERVPFFPADDFAAVAAFLAMTPSRLVAIAIDDVLGEIDQVNVPGTVDQHPNWRRRLSVAIEDLDAQGGLARMSDAFGRAGRNISV